MRLFLYRIGGTRLAFSEQKVRFNAMSWWKAVIGRTGALPCGNREAAESLPTTSVRPILYLRWLRSPCGPAPSFYWLLTTPDTPAVGVAGAIRGSRPDVAVLRLD